MKKRRQNRNFQRRSGVKGHRGGTSDTLAAAGIAHNVAPRNASVASAEAVQLARRNAFNPIRSLTPEALAAALEAFDYGDLRNAAMLWYAIAERDDTIKGVKAKREKAVAQKSWEILTVDDSPEAKRHAKTLEYFYNHLTATSAYDRNERGGVSLLVRRMMEAVSYRYSVHHIVWQPGAEGLTATFEHVPLWFFENRTGTLRFVQSGIGLDGKALTPGEWMVCTGDGLMASCSIAYVYKRLAMRDWVAYSEKFGFPGVLGRTRAAQESDAGRAMRSAVENFGNDFSAVLYGDEGDGKIELIEAKGGAGLPQPKLVEQMDRKIASLYRGADLSTMSRGTAGSNGSSVQSDETELLEIDDAQLVSEALNTQVDRWVIRYQHGTDTPLAYIKVMIPPKEDVERNLRVDQFLIASGVPIALDDLAERYGRTSAPEGEAIARKPEAPPAPPAPGAVAANERPMEDDPDVGAFLASARDQYAAAAAADLRPLSRAIATVLHTHGNDFDAGLAELGEKLPALAEELFRPGQSDAALERIIGTALLNGVAERTASANANPHHDPKDGRFAFGPGGEAKEHENIEGDPEELAEILQRQRANGWDDGWPYENWYLHGRGDGDDLDTGHVIQTTKSPDVAEQYASKSGSIWAIRPSSDAKTLTESNFSSLYKLFREDADNGTLPPALEAAGRLTEKELRAEVFPPKIVDSAGLWDEPAFASWAYDRGGYQVARIAKTSVPGAAERDAVIVLDRDAITAIRTDDGGVFRWRDGVKERVSGKVKL